MAYGGAEEVRVSCGGDSGQQAAGSRPSPMSRMLRAHVHMHAGSRESRPAAGFYTQSSPAAHTFSSQAAPKPPKAVTNWESRFQGPHTVGGISFAQTPT